MRFKEVLEFSEHVRLKVLLSALNENLGVLLRIICVHILNMRYIFSTEALLD